MSRLSRSDLLQATAIGFSSGGLSGGVTLLVMQEFDKNTVFAFLGAIVGGAIVVLLSIGEQERINQRANQRECEQIDDYFSLAKSLIDKYLGSPFKTDEHDRLEYVGCVMAQSVISNLLNFTEQAVNHASHVNFLQRSQLQDIHAACKNADKSLS
jgi:hypothetical protein